MNFSLSALILFSILIFAKSDDNFCAIRRDVLKSEWEKLQNIFNLTSPDPLPLTCEDIQNSFVKIIEGINEESFINSEKSAEYKELQAKLIAKYEDLKAHFEGEKKMMTEDFEAQKGEIKKKIDNTIQEIKNVNKEHKNLIKSHNQTMVKFDNCRGEPKLNVFLPRASTYHLKRRFGAAPEQQVLCKITHEWFMDLKTLVDSKVSSSFELELADDCKKKREWFFSINNVFEEAIIKASQNFDIEALKVEFERRFAEQTKGFNDLKNQLTQENERLLKSEADYLQQLNLDLQNVKQVLSDLKAQQSEELKQLAVKLIDCSRFDLAVTLIDEVESKDFLKEILSMGYDNSTGDDKTEKIMKFIAQIQSECRKFEALIVIYSIINSRSHQESPTMIEIIKQIRQERFPAKDCGVEYNQTDFLSPTLATDPIVDQIINILSDNVKVGSYDKIVTLSYYHPLTFGEIMPTLVEKSYTEENLKNMLDFLDSLYWLLHKYDVLEKLLDISAPKKSEDKKLFAELVKNIVETETRFYEHEDRLTPLKRKMEQNGIKVPK